MALEVLGHDDCLNCCYACETDHHCWEGKEAAHLRVVGREHERLERVQGIAFNGKNLRPTLFDWVPHLVAYSTMNSSIV